MGLLCALGRHRPEPWPRWNAGYYFTTCGRCGRDLVRTAYGSWHTPEGCKVVWRATAPENAITADLASEDKASPPADAAMKAGIEEVLRTLGAGIPPDIESDEAPEDKDTCGEALAVEEAATSIETPTEPLIPPEIEEPAPVASHIPDFMDEDDGSDSWDETWHRETDRPSAEIGMPAERPESVPIRSRP